MIKIKKLNITYNKETILSNFSLSLPNTGLFILQGSSGCGKSSILKLLSGRFNLNLIFTGEIFINKNKLESNRHNFGLICSYMEQTPHFIAELSVKDNIMVNAIDKNDPAIMQIIKRLQIQHLLKSKIHNLSAGEKARVALARTIIANTPILLLDEPLACLNTELYQQIYDYLLELSKTRLIIMSSHVNVEGDTINVCDNSNSIQVASSKIKYKNTNKAPMGFLIFSQIKKHIKPLMALSFFNTVALVFILLGFILSQSTAGQITSLIPENEYFFDLITSKQHLSETDLMNVRTIFSQAEIEEVFFVEKEISLFNEEKLSIVPTIINSSYMGTQCLSHCIILPEKINKDKKTIVLVDNIALDINWTVKTHQFEQIFLISKDIEQLTNIIASLFPEETVIRKINTLKVNSVSEQEQNLLKQNNILISQLFKTDHIYYQIFTQRELFQIQEEPKIFPLGTSFFYQGNTIIFFDINWGQIILKFTKDKETSISSSLAFLTNNKTLNLAWLETNNLNNELYTKNTSLTYNKTFESKTHQIVLSWNDAKNIASNNTKEAIVLYTDEEKELINKEEHWQTTSFWTDFKIFFSEFSSFLKNTMLIIAGFCLIIGLLIIILTGTYLFLHQEKKFQLLYLLGFSKLKVVSLYASNFIFLATVSFINSLIFIIVSLPNLQKQMNSSVTFLINNSPIQISLFGNFEVTAFHFRNLAILSAIVPIIAFLINYVIYYKRFYPET